MGAIIRTSYLPTYQDPYKSTPLSIAIRMEFDRCGGDNTHVQGSYLVIFDGLQCVLVLTVVRRQQLGFNSLSRSLSSLLPLLVVFPQASLGVSISNKHFMVKSLYLQFP